MRKRLTAKAWEVRLPKKGFRETGDSNNPLIFREAATGARTFCIRTRIKGQKGQVRIPYPKDAVFANLKDARKWATATVEDCKAGKDPRAPKITGGQFSFDTVAAAYLKTNGVFKINEEPWKPRTLDEYKRVINGRLTDKFKGRVIHSITKDEIIDYLAEIAKETPVTANRVLAVLSGLMSWYAAQRDNGDFRTPIVKGMAPTAEHARERILSDEELKTVWHVAGKSDVFGAIVKMLLLTAARKNEAATMKRSQIGSDGIWALPGEHTKNSVPLYLPLSPQALAIVTAQDQVNGSDLVFTVGGSEFKNWSQSKVRFDQRVKAHAGREFDNWVLHDLRRTARSLMARAGVGDPTAERVLNHTIGGVEGVYNRHSYEAEKRDALVKLATLIDSIVS